MVWCAGLEPCLPTKLLIFWHLCWHRNQFLHTPNIQHSPVIQAQATGTPGQHAILSLSPPMTAPHLGPRLWVNLPFHLHARTPRPPGTQWPPKGAQNEGVLTSHEGAVYFFCYCFYYLTWFYMYAKYNIYICASIYLLHLYMFNNINIVYYRIHL